MLHGSDNGSLSISNEEGEDDYNFDQQYPDYVLAAQEEQAPIIGGPRQLSSRMGTASRNAPNPQMLPSRMGTGSQNGGGSDSMARPMTSIASANYNARPSTSSGGNLANRGSAPPLVKKVNTSPEAITKELEKRVNALIEESAFESMKGEMRSSLEKAKEALKKDNALKKHRETNQIEPNLDLTYAVYFNLANQYHKSGLHQEALNTYGIIVKNKAYAQGARMRVNMGNIYMEMKKYNEAIKNYRMASDQIPNTSKELRFKVMRNIGNAFVASGNFQSAVQSFEAVMEASPDFSSAFNLILCYYSIGNKEKMKSIFNAMLKIRGESGKSTEGGDDEPEVEEAAEEGNVPNDTLRQEMRERSKKEDRVIILASKLIAPVIEKDFATGYDFIVETMRATRNTDLANELEISKALTFMKKRDIQKAIETLKEFEKKDQAMAGAASTNLSFLYFLEKDYKNAEKYANLALKQDPYNAKAFVNKGNCSFIKGNFEEAKELFHEALSCESDCIEAMYNLGLVSKRMGHYEAALKHFMRLDSVLPNHGEVVFQMAALQEQMGNMQAAEQQYKTLITLVPSDPRVLQRIGSLVNEQDDIAALGHYQDSYRYFPADLNVLSWLGAYHSRSESYEKAIQYFQRGAQLEPSNAKWRLLVAGCYRKLRNYSQAKDLYEEILKKNPDHVEALRHLVTICNDLGYKDQVDSYVARLRKVEQGGGSKDSADDALDGKTKNSNNRDNNKSLPRSSSNSKGFGGSYDDDETVSSPVAASFGFGSSDRNSAPKTKKKLENDWGTEDMNTIGPRPGTAGLRKKVQPVAVEEDFGDDMNDDMLPL